MSDHPGVQRLRLATRELHKRTEAEVGLGEALTLPTYLRFLTLWWGFLRPLEPVLLAGGSEFEGELDLRGRRKLPWLERDLLELGLEAGVLAQLPACKPVLAADASWPRKLGCLYVIEGATLGGQILTRLVREQLADEAPATRFISSYGKDVGPKWRVLVRALEHTMNSPDIEAELIAGARDTFTAFANWAASHPLAPR